MGDTGSMALYVATRSASVPGSVRRSIWELAVPALVMDASVPCTQVDAALWADEDAMEHTSLVVHDAQTGRVGFLSRRRFERKMSGRFGFGRALLGRTPIGDITDWHDEILPETVSLTSAVNAVLSRRPSRRYDDLILQGSGEWRRLAAAAVLEELAAAMARRATRDDLTGLANRAAFFDGLEDLGRRVTDSESVAVIFIDLDRMKVVNDSLGHNVGDALLVSVARRLSAAARPGDIVARLGGDEFAVALALPSLDGPAASKELTRHAQRFLSAVQRLDPDLDSRAQSTASIGAAASSSTASTGPETLMREADIAMYRAKQAGGDRVVVTAQVGSGLDAAANVADLSLRQALAEGELELYYQPIIDVTTGRIISVEALIRWNHPTLGLLGADRVLAAGEAETALVALDLWVLRSALEQLITWTHRLADQAPTWINVNLSNASVGDPRLSSNILGILADLGCPAGRLRLELPETASLALAVAAASELTALVDAGVLLTLDDMGTGASSLGHLSAVTVTEMKIDRSFVERMLTDVRDHAVVQMLTRLAAGIGIRVTAEGVETREQLLALQALGIDYVQGFLLDRPARASEIEGLLATQSDHRLGLAHQ